MITEHFTQGMSVRLPSDAAMLWMFFDKSSRKICKEVLQIDEETWNRARGWALWKALITYDANKSSNKIVAEESYRVI